MSELQFTEPAPPGLLIIEGDAVTLRRQGHTKFCDSLVESLAPRVSEGKFRVHRVVLESRGDLEFVKGLAPLARFPAVLLLAHGNSRGAQAAPGVFMSWRDIAAALAPIRPRHLMAVACCAGSSLATDMLFDGIPTLDRIIGSPTFLSTGQAEFAKLDLLAAAYGYPLPMELSVASHLLNSALTQGVLFSRTRAGRETTTAGERVLEDVAGIFCAALLNGLGDDHMTRPIRRQAHRGGVSGAGLGSPGGGSL